MRVHPELSREDVVRWGPQKIALMVANEFRVASRSDQFHVRVIESYHRARELMGVLETINLPSHTAMKLAPFYRLCAAQRLFRKEFLNPSRAKHFALWSAKAFERAAQELSHA